MEFSIEERQAIKALHAKAGYKPPQHVRVIHEDDDWRTTEDEHGVRVFASKVPLPPESPSMDSLTIRLENSLIGDGLPGWSVSDEFYEVMRELHAAWKIGFETGNPTILYGVRGTKVTITNSIIYNGEELCEADHPVVVKGLLGA